MGPRWRRFWLSETWCSLNIVRHRRSSRKCRRSRNSCRSIRNKISCLKIDAIISRNPSLSAIRRLNRSCIRIRSRPTTRGGSARGFRATRQKQSGKRIDIKHIRRFRLFHRRGPARECCLIISRLLRGRSRRIPSHDVIGRSRIKRVGFRVIG
jgi:hypothetical protein